MERAQLKALVQATGCSVESGAYVFLCDAGWNGSERARREALIARAPTVPPKADRGWLCVPTGGSSGGVRFACHDELTLTSAAEGFQTHFGLQKVNAVDVLPPFHVSGLMARVRCAVSGGTHRAWPWKRLEASDRPPIAGDDWVLSLVPTQLQRLLTSSDAVAWLRAFRIIFLGGGPSWPELLDAAAHAGLRLSLSYGMTETAAMVTALQPEEFLQGGRSSGTALPHATIAVTGAGRILVGGGSLFRGYFPDQSGGQTFQTDDLGTLDERGNLHVLGRSDAVIITGGEKVNPVDVEDALRATGEFRDVAVVGVPDPEWGSAIVACYPRAECEPNLARVEAALQTLLAGFKRPKRYLPVNDWPRNAQGKLNRSLLVAAAREIVDGLSGA